MVLEYFQKNPPAMQQLAGPIFEDKVIDFILEMAEVTTVVIDKDTLYQKMIAIPNLIKTQPKHQLKRVQEKSRPQKKLYRKSQAQKSQEKRNRY